MNEMPVGPDAGYFSADECDLKEFSDLVLQKVDPEDVPLASEVEKNVPIYDMKALRGALADRKRRQGLMAEWARVLRYGAGVFLLKSSYADLSVIDAATRIYEDIIARERREKGAGADHFAASGSNDRVWNSLQKLCEADPGAFVRYFANPAIDAACEAWLGPNYQMTAQVNLVHPGGAAQQAHRDYHLGFQTAEVSARYPAAVHELSPLMTLQGGIVHGAAPLESGPTKLLPFSQLYRPGYAAWRRGDFRAFFEDHHIQLPLEKGDAVFFNPALFHAAGANSSQDIHRMVNLLQVSSAFGRAMEAVDRRKMLRLVFDPLKQLLMDHQFSETDLNAVISATAEGYSFPTNLDRDPPTDGLAPRSQAEVLKEAVLARWSSERLQRELDAQAERKRP